METEGRSCLLAFDGYLGVKWERIVPKIRKELSDRGVESIVIDFNIYYHSPSEIEKIIVPHVKLETDFGFVFKGRLTDLLDSTKIGELRKELREHRKRKKEPSAAIICYGYGAAIPSLRRLYDKVLYFDLTREKLFNESKEKPTSLGNGGTISFNQFLKRFYYVDSQVLDKQKRYAIKYMNWYVESNIPQELKIIPRRTYNRILSKIAQYPFAIKPLYYPVTWGGNWLKKIKKLPESMVNSGQGFIVARENSIRIATNGVVMEIPFLNLLWAEPQKILGEYVFRKFKGEFPLTYYYDDGVEGGHMAIQVHANGTFMKKHFNEPIRQDESYYILFAGSGAKTYLGLRDSADIDEFRRVSTKAEKEGVPFDHDKYVNSILTEPGDYFLIPNGTVHSSGRNQVVLEIDGGISAYGPSYTLHIYDYLRPDLEGQLRSIHIENSFSVLKDRKATWVSKNLKQEPRLIRSAKDGTEYLLGRRKGMYYEVRRLEFSSRMEDGTNGRFHALTLVKGESILVQSKREPQRKYNLDFPDTLIVPACIGKYILLNLSSKPCSVVKALVK